MFVQSVMFFDGTPALARASKQVGQLYGMTSGRKGVYAKQVNKIAKSYTNILEEAIAKATFSHKIAEKPNWGLQPDLLTVIGGQVFTSEVKNSLLQYLRDAEGMLQITRDKSIRLGSSVKISASAKGLTTGYDSEGNPINTKFSDAEEFFNRYKKNPKALTKDLLKPHGNLGATHKQALDLIKANMMLKARELNIPFMANETTLANITMRFNPEDILKYANAKLNKAGDIIHIQFKFHEKLLADAFARINQDPRIRPMLDRTSDAILQEIDNQLQTASLDTLSGLLIQAEEELKTLSISLNVEYEKGSVIAYKGSAKFVRRAQKAEEELGILDITQFVQGRVKLRMRRGTGVPHPPKIYNRTERFKGSIQAYYNFRDNVAKYDYMPLYDSLEKHGYEINKLVTGSVRDIVLERLNREIRLKRY